MNEFDNSDSKFINELDSETKRVVELMEESFDNSRDYSDTVDTIEKRMEQIDRVQDALDKAMYREAAEYWSIISNLNLLENELKENQEERRVLRKKLREVFIRK